jgi:hypothetical protein
MATLLNPGAAATEAAELQRALEPNPGKFQWDFALIIGAFHLGALLAFFAFRWSALAVFAVTWVLTQNIGIPGGWNIRWQFAALWRSREARFIGSPCTDSTINLPTSQVTPTLREMANGGRTWGGS